MMLSHLKTYKSLYRNKIRNQTSGIGVFEAQAQSRKIVRKLFQMPCFLRARNVLMYVSKPGEVDTRYLIRQTLKLKKFVYVPKINLKNRKMEAVRITNPSHDLMSGPFGILQPKEGKKSKRHLDLIIAPGLAFDRFGGRLGRGGGYFDRFLSAQKKAIVLGLAFKEQMVDRVPVTGKDVLMDGVITGEGMIFKKKGLRL